MQCNFYRPVQPVDKNPFVYVNNVTDKQNSVTVNQELIRIFEFDYKVTLQHKRQNVIS